MTMIVLLLCMFVLVAPAVSGGCICAETPDGLVCRGGDDCGDAFMDLRSLGDPKRSEQVSQHVLDGTELVAFCQLPLVLSHMGLRLL